MDKPRTRAERVRQWLSAQTDRWENWATQADSRGQGFDKCLSKLADQLETRAAKADDWGEKQAARSQHAIANVGSRIGRFFVKWRWLVVVVTVALLLASATVAAGLLFTGSYHDSSHRWTAWTAVLAGSTVVVALLGLPFALYQLVIVRRDLNIVTQASEFEQNLNANMLEGVELLERLGDQTPTPTMLLEHAGWVEAVGNYIRIETGSEVEEKLFRLEGQGCPTPAQLQMQILHVRDRLIPKVRAGYFSR